MPWGSPIVGGGGALVRDSIQSANFVAGVSGWRITRNGDAEFNDATVRGELLVTNASGSQIHAFANGVLSEIDFVPPNSSTPGVVFGAGAIYASSVGDNPSLTMQGADLQQPSFIPAGQLQLFVDVPTGKSASALTGEEVFIGDGGAGTLTVLDSTTVSLSGDNLVDSKSHQYLRGENGQFNISFTNLATRTGNVSFAHAFTSAPMVTTNINSSSGTVSKWISRAFSITTTGFTYWVQSADGSLATWASVSLQWSAHEFTP